MTHRVDLIVRNGTVVTPAGRGEQDIAVEDGRIVAIARRGGLALRASREVDATGRHVLPGVIDGHVHFRDPGLTDKEDFRTGSRAAVMGGVTTVLDMPNTRPLTDSAEHAQVKIDEVTPKAYCDFGLIGLVVSENVGRLRSMALAGQVVGFKAFLGISVGGVPAPDDGAVLDAMREIRSLGMRLGFHAENNQILDREIARLKAAGRRDPLAHVESRPVLAEVESVGRMGLFARATGCPIHIFHLSSRPGLEMVDHWRGQGVDCTAETAAHYCFLGAEDMATLGARLRVNPPVRLRAEGHGDALVEGLATGRVTGIATDHAPHTREEKLHEDIWKAASGFAGVEISVRLFLTYAVSAGRMSLERFARASSEGPARTWGLYPRKGAILVGSDADLTIVDLEAADTIEEARLHGKNNLTPFEGHPTKGAAVGTILRGEVVMEDGELTAEPAGRLVRGAAWEPSAAWAR
jgi:dihydroorotase/allantoinase